MGAEIVRGCGVDLRVGVMWVVQRLKVRQVGVLVGAYAIEGAHSCSNRWGIPGIAKSLGVGA